MQNQLPGKNEMEDKDFYWDWSKQNDSLLWNRTSYFLVAEAMLFVGIATLFAVAQTNIFSKIIILTSFVVAIIISLVWLKTNQNFLEYTDRKVKNCLRQFEPRWADISRGRPQIFSNSVLNGYILPSVVVSFWIYLFLIYIAYLGGMLE